MKEKKQIGFCDLSWWLKVLVVYGFLCLTMAVLWITVFIVGIFLAI